MVEIKTDDNPVIIGFQGEMDNQRWMLRDTLILGRDSGCDIVIPNRQVSRQHAKVTMKAEGIFLEDLGSKNGTHRNGTAISEPERLGDGDVIHIALAQKFVFMSADATLPLESEVNLLTEPPENKRLYLEKRSRRVWVSGIEIIPPLSVSQFRLLGILYENNGQLVPREDVISVVWGKENKLGISEQALDALVRRLRDRLSSVDPTHSYVVTVRGHGFRLDNPPLKENS
jgi:DNA-binding winged helix-turn-helix (wHTH) protein